ncbi:hypothetical protein ETU09_05950 [Apibacter muscae]|uniref:XRE family transcriptional regulator n=1 Tax=Apibacter muscae TaxID=2509004 RepID=A0A563DE36_9FLAO|nr:hypothetical protein [Apibacter muscae]TWP28466.1 hypothetical protein ETU09_05950 [Apibacter muscae]
MKSINDQMIALIDILKKENKIRFDADFCRSAEIARHYLVAVRKGQSNFTIKHVKNICLKYEVNANWIFGIQKNIFINIDTDM